jgi:hypothetical protein
VEKIKKEWNSFSNSLSLKWEKIVKINNNYNNKNKKNNFIKESV